ncbi:diguanylate cyclase [Luteitalea sp. TBR-22]|uniref:DinB family protein n=1 Tax=Luteitalea sp. TBR-22 TaxID=2802971 RepID=UPI001AF6A035|nr:DinB family protein [Luteitalea sp. TBR-22]BCS32243.1 diguanylate cyclase [Luteitalea sp. TBR-22]
MTRNDLGRLVDYHYWARDRLLQAVARLDAEAFTRDLGSSFASVRDTLAHLQGAEWIWISRFKGESPTQSLPLERFATLDELRAAWVVTEADLRALVDGLPADGSARVAYRLLNGQPGENTIAELVQHLVNHGTYHRGQVVTMLRQLGATPPASMDLVAFFREHPVP